jgi:CHASE2 domain-containing sensor protein
MVVALSILPWAKFGDTSGLFEAWTPHWSMLAVGAALVGLVAAIATWRRPRDPRLEVALQLGLAVVVGVAAFLHYRRPPPLSASSPTPIVAMLAAGLPAVSGVVKGIAILRLRRPSVPR